MVIRQTLSHYIKADRQTCLCGVTAATVGPEMEGRKKGKEGRKEKKERWREGGM